jgi:23S rRNA (guanine745-N1)-methyltransferase
VLRPDGRLIVVSPQAGHLRELASVVDLLEVDDRKDERLDSALGGYFEPVSREELTEQLTLSPDAVRHLAWMGPSAHHPTRLARLSTLTGPLTLTASFHITTYRKAVP